jgi:hypothetical protein
MDGGKVIHKQVLSFLRPNKGVVVPKGSQFLDFQNQAGNPVVWYLRDDGNGALEMEERVLAIFGTGHPILPEYKLKDYIGTAQFEGNLVFHLFELAR